MSNKPTKFVLATIDVPAIVSQTYAEMAEFPQVKWVAERYPDAEYDCRAAHFYHEGHFTHMVRVFLHVTLPEKDAILFKLTWDGV